MLGTGIEPVSQSRPESGKEWESERTRGLVGGDESKQNEEYGLVGGDE